MSNWLAKQKKVELNDLAAKAGFDGASGLKKDELVESLDKYLQANSSKLSSKSAFEDYYSEADSKGKARAPRRTTKSPVDFKAESSPVRAVATAVKEKATEVKETLATRTPRAVKNATASMQMPNSPAAVTDMVERQSRRLSTNVQSYWDKFGLTEYAEAAREYTSTVYGIQVLLIALEAYGLQRAVLPWRYAFTVPGLKVTNPLAISFPDFFAFITSDYWGPSSLWLMTSLIVPAIAAWFFNMTYHSRKVSARYTVDPFVFCVVKAVLAWLVYGPPQFQVAGWVAKATAIRVDSGVLGGWFGIVIGSGVGALASLYEVALRK